MDRAGLEKLIASHAGQVVLVDVWATWCLPCRQGFPHTVELANQYRGKGLRVVSLAIELDPQADREKTLAFLRQQKAEFDNLISQYEFDRAFEEFDIEAGLPEYWVYGRDGRLVHKFTNADPDHPTTPDEIEQAVREALGLK